MSEYADFPKDFLIRTKNNLQSYSGTYEVTNLINSCLGLIIIPKQLLIRNLTAYEFSDNDKTYGFSKENIKYEEENNFKLDNVLRHIRNGLSHGCIEQKSVEKEIAGIRIFDRYNENSPENFSVELSIDELKQFALKLSDNFINQKK